ncbi:hypothetical protein, partial [Vescimonas sp.]|uniref:hypothetical protein n=1 Tax=Vescimonas sp. TaxID=2892404 RepID=UPI0030783102
MKSKHKSSYFPTHPHAEMAEKRRRGTGGTQLRKSPAATLLRIFKLPCAPAQRDTRRFTPLILQTKNEPSPFGIETEKAHLHGTHLSSGAELWQRYASSSASIRYPTP